MIRGEVSNSIPIDLTIEILSRLPVKSIARFRCVSKLWESMFLGPHFTELFLTRSSAQSPRLLFVVGGYNDWCFFTSPQPHNPYEKSSSLLIAADFHMKFRGGVWPRFCYRVSGLIYFMPSKDACITILNPTTGQYASLPLPKGNNRKSLLGFDPIEKQYKLLSYEDEKAPDQILTIGTGNGSWRKIYCSVNHHPHLEGICINGVLYYLAYKVNNLSALIVCFDVRSETFKFIYRDFFRPLHRTKLINYKGKLGVITLEYDWSYSPDRSSSLELCMYVIKDAEKPESSEWSKYFSSFHRCYKCDLSIVGVTAIGEIVLSTTDASKPLYVFFLNLEKNTRQRVEIKGFGAIDGGVKVFVDHVEDLKFITMKTTSLSSNARLRQQDRRSTFERRAYLMMMKLLDLKFYFILFLLCFALNHCV